LASCAVADELAPGAVVAGAARTGKLRLTGPVASDVCGLVDGLSGKVTVLAPGRDGVEVLVTGSKGVKLLVVGSSGVYMPASAYGGSWLLDRRDRAGCDSPGSSASVSVTGTRFGVESPPPPVGVSVTRVVVEPVDVEKGESAVGVVVPALHSRVALA